MAVDGINLFGTGIEEGLALARRVDPKYRPVWDGRAPAEQAALARYFLPHESSKPILGPTRPRVIKWYCPFADHRKFPSGHRYCINVYTGCEHQCEYCYVSGYANTPLLAAGGQVDAKQKENFPRLLRKDLEDLERFDVPPAPLHLSNSTDPFQSLEANLGHAKLALEHILAHRNRFTTVTVLTKNPMLAVSRNYIDLFNSLVELPTDHPCRKQFAQVGQPGFCLEVSMAFWRDEARAAYEHNAPHVQDRIEGIRAIRSAGIPLALRIDPLFPRSPLGEGSTRTLADFELTEAQTLDDLAGLVRFAKEVGARYVVYSAAKIVQPRSRPLSDTMRAMLQAYKFLAALQKLIFRGGAWRLPADVADNHIVNPFLDICRREGIPARHCKHNLLGTL